MKLFGHLGLLGFFLAAWIVPAAHAVAAQTGNHHALVQQGLDHFYNLEYDRAIDIFKRLRDAEPDNPVWHNHLATAYFYKQLYLAGALQGDLFSASNRFFERRRDFDPELQELFVRTNDTAVRLCEARIKQDSRNQAALYACGVAYASRSAFKGLVERARLGFIGSARQANDYHTRLLRLNPRFYDAYLVTGIYDFVLGSLPPPLRALLFVAGTRGNKERGLTAVQSTAQWGRNARDDAKVMLAVMYRRERQYDDARRMLQELAGSYPRNYLLPLEIASLHRADEDFNAAIRQYESVLDRSRSGAPGFQSVPVARVHFELGVLNHRVENLEAARDHFAQVPGSRGSSPNLEKESTQMRQQVEREIRQRAQAPSRAASQPAR